MWIKHPETGIVREIKDHQRALFINNLGWELSEEPLEFKAAREATQLDGEVEEPLKSPIKVESKFVIEKGLLKEE